jgi:hypothetical protein
MTHITDDMIQRGKEALQVKPVAWRSEDAQGHVYVTLQQDIADGWKNDGVTVLPLYASPLPTASGVEVKPAEIEDLIEQLLDAQQNINLAANENMDQSLCDASALIDKTEEMLHRILSTLSLPAQEPLPTVEVTEEMVERAAKATFEEGSVVSWETAAELAETDPASAYGSVMGSFRRTARTALTAALSQNKATHRHKKRGTEYVLIGIGKMHSKKWYPVDMREVAIYRSATDPTEIWVRPREEFEDGRFEALSQNKGE